MVKFAPKITSLTILKVVNKSGFELPKYETASSAGLDLRAVLETKMVLKPLGRQLIGTGLFLELPEGVEAQIRPRSGLAFQHGLTVLNGPGTIDSDYRGEVKVLIINLGNKEVEIHPGDRIAQMVINKYERVSMQEVSDLSTTARGPGGYGHTGKR